MTVAQKSAVEGVAQIYSPEILSISNDNKYVIMSGALPLVTVQNLINIMLGVAKTE